MFGDDPPPAVQPRRAASAAPASVLVKYGDVPGFVSSTQYCTASERETTMRPREGFEARKHILGWDAAYFTQYVYLKFTTNRKLALRVLAF